MEGGDSSVVLKWRDVCRPLSPITTPIERGDSARRALVAKLKRPRSWQGSPGAAVTAAAYRSATCRYRALHVHTVRYPHANSRSLDRFAHTSSGSPAWFLTPALTRHSCEGCMTVGTSLSKRAA